MLPHSRPRRASQSVDGESLQADVMRFMAIIGFCLVAIMGLVRDVNPPGAAPAAETEPRNIDRPTIVEPQVVVVPPVVVQPQAVIESPPAMASQKVVKPKTVVEQPSVAETVSSGVSEQASEPVVEPVPEPLVAVKSPVESVAPQHAEEGLSLRFHSDRDFLRLVSSGEVALYLFNSQQAFRLASDYVLYEAPVPGQLYELMPQTIPAGIRLSAESLATDVSNYHWGVVMPDRVAQRIATLVATENSGQLVIDRFGSVRHEQERG